VEQSRKRIKRHAKSHCESREPLRVDQNDSWTDLQVSDLCLSQRLYFTVTSPSLSLSASLSLSVCACLSTPSLSVSLYVFLSLSRSLSHSDPPSLSLSLRQHGIAPPTNSDLDQLKYDPLYSSLYNSSPSSALIGDRGTETTQRTLFTEELSNSLVEPSIISSSGDDHEYPGGAIIKCLDEMKRLTDECQRRSFPLATSLTVSHSLSLSVSLCLSVSVSQLCLASQMRL
jgi:hypothetical protein